jgi:hypothetical protein
VPEPIVLDARYVAGIIDGEGTVGVYFNTQGVVNLRVNVGCTCRELIDSLAITYGGSVCVKRQQNPNAKHCWVWQASSKAVSEKVLRAIAPYVFIKRDQVSLALRFLELTSTHRNYRSNAENAEILDIAERFRTLNRKGPSKNVEEVV